MKVRSIGVMALLVTGVVVGCTPGAVAPTAGAPASAAPPSLVPSPAAATPSAAPSIVAPPSVGPSAVATSQAPAATAAPSLAPEPSQGTALPPDPSADHTIGDRIILSDFFEEEQAAITVVEAIQLPQSDPASGPQYAFLVEIEGLTASIHYNVQQFSMFDDESFEYQPEFGVQQPELEFGDLPKGRKVRGWLTFVGPDSSEYLELQWAPITTDPVFVLVLLP